MRFSPDIESWHGYLARMEEEFYEHAGFAAQIWRMEFKGGTSFERAFVGPWHTVRPWVTTEFREWIDEYDVERVTLTEWIRRRRAEREIERMAYEDEISWACLMAMEPF